jgi:hypothetical protein
MAWVEIASGGTRYPTAGTGVPETILDISGVGIIQFVYAGAASTGGSTTLELNIDGVSLYNTSRGNTNLNGLAACGSVFIQRTEDFASCVYGNYVFTQGFEVIVTTTTASLEVVANYYLTS